MAGNAWECVSDWYRADYYQWLAAQADPTENPKGPSDSFDPNEAGVKKRVMRGGSTFVLPNIAVATKLGGGARAKLILAPIISAFVALKM